MILHCPFCKLEFSPLYAGRVEYRGEKVVEEIYCPHCMQPLLFQTHVIRVVRLKKPKLVGYRRDS